MFEFLKQITHSIIIFLIWLGNVRSLCKPSPTTKPNLISAIVKFNIAREGYYTPAMDANPAKPYEVILRCFEHTPLAEGPDFKVAQAALNKHLALMRNLGDEPGFWLKTLIRLLTRMPYHRLQVPGYITHYSQNDLWTEQHLSGGCVLGKALALGEDVPENTGKVLGSENIYLADLSAAPLPRVSPQMTAYLVGHHVATQLCK